MFCNLASPELNFMTERQAKQKMLVKVDGAVP